MMNIRTILKFLFGGEKPIDRPPTAAPIDLGKLSAIMDEDDDNILFSILHKFVEKFPALLDNLEIAIEGCDAQSVRDRAHAAKGASQGVGARALSEILKEIEAGDHLGNWDETKSRFDATRSEFARIVAFCENHN